MSATETINKQTETNGFNDIDNIDIQKNHNQMNLSEYFDTL